MSNQKAGGCKKSGRTERKRKNRGNPISLFVRGKITAENYFKLTNQTYKV